MSTSTFCLHDAEFVVLRSLSWEEMTFAIVQAKVNDTKLLYEVRFRDALIQAVTAWVKQSEAGQQLWEYSCQDLNIGDLAAHGFDQGLQPFLEAVDICELSIQANFNHAPCQHWTYDTTLVDQLGLEVEVSQT